MERNGHAIIMLRTARKNWYSLRFYFSIQNQTSFQVFLTIHCYKKVKIFHQKP